MSRALGSVPDHHIVWREKWPGACIHCQWARWSGTQMEQDREMMENKVWCGAFGMIYESGTC